MADAKTNLRPVERQSAEVSRRLYNHFSDFTSEFAQDPTHDLNATIDELVTDAGQTIFIGPVDTHGADQGEQSFEGGIFTATDAEYVRVYRAFTVPSDDDVLGAHTPDHRSSTVPYRIGLGVNGQFAALTASQTIGIACELLEWITTLAEAGQFGKDSCSPLMDPGVMRLHVWTRTAAAVLEASGADLDGSRLVAVRDDQAAKNSTLVDQALTSRQRFVVALARWRANREAKQNG